MHAIPFARRVLALACALAGLAAGCASRRVTVPLMPPFLPAARPAVFWEERFDTLDPDRWREVSVRRRTDYSVAELNGRSCLRAASRNGASVLLAAVAFEPDGDDTIAWDWRVDTFVKGESLREKSGSDAPVRVYVYFETGGMPWQKRSLDYVWSATLPAGTVIGSAFSPLSKIIVANSGTEGAGQWTTVERNLEQDYLLAFGSGPVPRVIAIGLMTDSDNSQGEALAYYDDIRITRRPVRQSAAASP
jgi:hypothetical protein